jgi:poly-beta-hydroxyalkanoate depolymerase
MHQILVVNDSLRHGAWNAPYAFYPCSNKHQRGVTVRKGAYYYGVFKGSKFSKDVAPLMINFIRAAEQGRAVASKLG